MMAALFFSFHLGAMEKYYFPGTQITLEPGDIVLNDAVGVSSVFNRNFGTPVGPYTHASIYLEFPGKGGRLVGFTDTGITFSNPDRLLRRNHRVALVRALNPLATERLAEAYTNLAIRPLRFDYSMTWPALESNLTYCVGFISQLYRLAGYEKNDPFPAPEQVATDTGFLHVWARKHLEIDLSQIVSPNAVMFNPSFRLLAEHRLINHFKEEKLLIQQVVLNKSIQYLSENEMEFGPLKLGSHLLFQLANAGFVDGITLAGMPKQHLRYFMQIHELIVSVEERVRRTIRLSDREYWPDEALQALTEEVTDAYRDQYFVSRVSQ